MIVVEEPTALSKATWYRWSLNAQLCSLGIDHKTHSHQFATVVKLACRVTPKFARRSQEDLALDLLHKGAGKTKVETGLR